MTTIVFHGVRRRDYPAQVRVIESGRARNLPTRAEVVNHSGATGFGWGSTGPPASQLALAMCLEVTDEARAVLYHRTVARSLLANLHDDEWTLNADDVIDALDTAEGAKQT